MSTLPVDRRTAPRSKADVLVVDDEEDIRELIELSLMRMGLNANTAGSVKEAKALLATHTYRLCLTDMRLPDGEGLDVVRHITEHCADIPVAVITAHGSMSNAVAALKAGAFDYLSKPVSLEQLRALVKSVFDVPARTSPQSVPESEQFLGKSPAMLQVHSLVERLARSQAPVYVSGESGSGKERAARMIHALSARAEQPFIAVNCGAIPENLMESEFFGYRKGAFTGAESDRDGFFQSAHGGTLFLDEVADLPLAMQVKLLRVIQERNVRRIGDSQEVPVNVRIISATHQNLLERVEKGLFRQDLFYRLNVIEIHMPALRERREDILLLAQATLERIAKENGTAVPKLTSAAVSALENYAFPGNVRELQNIIERAMALSLGGEIDVEDLRLQPQEGETNDSGAPAMEGGVTLQDYLDDVERQSILDSLAKTNGNRTASARLLGITFRSLRYRMERLGLKGDKNDE